MTMQPSLLSGYEHVAVVNTLPLREQPTERVLADSTACNAVELLAALVGGPRQIETATTLLTRFGSLSGILSASVAEVANIKGISRKAAARLKAALQIGIRAAHEVPEKAYVSSPGEAARILRPYFLGKEQEYVYVLMLNTRNRLIGNPVQLYHGSLNTSMIRIGELFREAIKWNAAAIILAHSHPSGDPSPSPEDVAVTRLAVEAGKLLDIPLHDHLVLGSGDRYVSLKERGLGFN